MNPYKAVVTVEVTTTLKLKELKERLGSGDAEVTIDQVQAMKVQPVPKPTKAPGF